MRRSCILVHDCGGSHAAAAATPLPCRMLLHLYGGGGAAFLSACFWITCRLLATVFEVEFYLQRAAISFFFQGGLMEQNVLFFFLADQFPPHHVFVPKDQR